MRLTDAPMNPKIIELKDKNIDERDNIEEGEGRKHP